MAAYLQKILQSFQHLKIPLEEIKSATDNFNNEKNCIGVGGFGKVYKGEVSHYRGRSMVAIKRLDKSNRQGTPEFLKEIMTLSRYSHENLISLLGFCYEEEEMILVYEHASRGSFDRYLNSPHLTWSQRIKICLDAAKGLRYLHDPGETHQRVIHCDIKSSNILLDEQWNAKVSDLGLSVVGSANEQQSVIVTVAAGTTGYIDPLYLMTHTLTKESDVYSFGVLLFEVLCGTLCYTKTLVPMWIESYEQKKLSDIIFKNPTTQSLDQVTLEIVSDIGYRCLNLSREDRPMMTEVITKLKTALESQEFSERKQPFDYEEIARSAEPRLNYISKFELWKLLMKGVLLNDGKTWFSLNKMEEHCEMISIAECLDSDTHECWRADNSRFAVSLYFLLPGEKCKVSVKTQFLSPGITYTLNIVLRKIASLHLQWVSLKYKLEGETETSNSNFVYKSDDGYWWALELYQFTSDQKDHEIVFEFEADTGIEVECIDFRPLEKVEERISYSDANWEEKIPAEYEEVMKLSKHSLQWSTKKEAYSILRKGLLVTDNGEDEDGKFEEDAWLSIDNDGKTCVMSPARAVFKRADDIEGRIKSSPESRFGEAFECTSGRFDSDQFNDQSEPSETVYYLVYKLPRDVEINHYVLVVDGEGHQRRIYLVCPETPVIGPKANQNTRSPMSRLNIKGLPRQRDDGWMEVQLWDNRSVHPIRIHFPNAITGFIIEGIEVRSTTNLFAAFFSERPTKTMSETSYMCLSMAKDTH